jgi:hypothetical protein
MRIAVVTLAALFVTSYLGTTRADEGGGYVETDLVVGGPDAKLVKLVPTLVDGNGVVHSAQVLDPNLVNAWGLTESTSAAGPPPITGSPFWVSDNGSGKATLYNVPSGTPLVATKNPRVVSIPSPPPGILWERAERRPATLGILPHARQPHRNS